MQGKSSTQPCPDISQFRETCLDPHGPQPYILMTLGRSGSGSTWQVIGNLTGFETPSQEYTGGGPAKSERFFEKHAGNNNDRWLLVNLCSKQLNFPEAGVVGFKWKPFETIFSPPAQAGLRRVASLKRPEILVVRSRRNLLVSYRVYYYPDDLVFEAFLSAMDQLSLLLTFSFFFMFLYSGRDNI